MQSCRVVSELPNCRIATRTEKPTYNASLVTVIDDKIAAPSAYSASPALRHFHSSVLLICQPIGVFAVVFATVLAEFWGLLIFTLTLTLMFSPRGIVRIPLALTLALTFEFTSASLRVFASVAVVFALSCAISRI